MKICELGQIFNFESVSLFHKHKDSTRVDALHAPLLLCYKGTDMARPALLSLTVPKRASAINSDITSPAEAGSNSPSPREAISVNARKFDPDTPQSPSAEGQPNSPDFTSLPPFPSSPKDGPRHAREPSKGFFSNLKASKSSNKVHQVEPSKVQPTIRQVSEDIPRRKHDMNENSIYSLRKSPGSTPDLSLSTTDGSSTEDREGLFSTSSQPL